MPTASPTATITADILNGVEVRPVRMLVPTVRKSDYWLNEQDTMRASDLGITRHTTDDELDALAGQESLRDFIPSALDLRRLRDTLAQPRDIHEAREWDFIIPINELENSEEVAEPDPNRPRLGWWWVYDPNRVETRVQRRRRYFADERPVDVRGMARIFCRSFATTKGLKIDTDRRRKIVDDPEHRRQLAEGFAANNPSLTVEAAEEKLLREAKRFLLKGTPRPIARGGRTDLVRVCDAIHSGRKASRLNEWYEFAKRDAPGRPRNSRNRAK